MTAVFEMTLETLRLNPIVSLVSEGNLSLFNSTGWCCCQASVPDFPVGTEAASLTRSTRIWQEPKSRVGRNGSAKPIITCLYEVYQTCQEIALLRKEYLFKERGRVREAGS
jgi:hypothetical protein